MMAEKPRSEKFECWLSGFDIDTVYRHMATARISKKSEFTRRALLEGPVSRSVERDWQIGELTMLVNQLVIIAATEKNPDMNKELRPLVTMIKKQIREFQKPPVQVSWP